MRESHLRALMAAEFGTGYADSVARDQVLTDLGGRTVEEALAAGVPPVQVWQALCTAMDVPPSRRQGADPDLPPAGSRAVPGPTPSRDVTARGRGAR